MVFQVLLLLSNRTQGSWIRIMFVVLCVRWRSVCITCVDFAVLCCRKQMLEVELVWWVPCAKGCAHIRQRCWGEVVAGLWVVLVSLDALLMSMRVWQVAVLALWGPWQLAHLKTVWKQGFPVVWQVVQVWRRVLCSPAQSWHRTFFLHTVEWCP